MSRFLRVTSVARSVAARPTCETRTGSVMMFTCRVTAACLSIFAASWSVRAQETAEGSLEGVGFIAINQAVEFEVAKQLCTARGTLLAGIISEHENNFIANLTNQLGLAEEDDFWLGCPFPIT